jgi:hypothetical protein
METIFLVPPRKSFNNVCGNRVSRPPDLLSELVPLRCRKARGRKTMQPNEQVVCALPSDERMMTEWH